MSSEEEEEAEEIPPSSPISEVDNDILRVLVSTDNHLGYCERDPVRGLDSFAAFEECLYLARKHKVSATSFCLCVFAPFFSNVSFF
jgi:hypothetical protein